MDDEGFALVEAADVVGVDDVAVAGSLAAESRVVEGVGLSVRSRTHSVPARAATSSAA